MTLRSVLFYGMFFLLIPIDLLCSGGCVITPFQVITATEFRVGDQVKIKATVGDIGSNPSSWVSTMLSDAFTFSYNFTPEVYSNTIGDVVVLWTYIDEAGVCQLAASILLHGTMTWYTSNISQGVGDARARDQICYINENGSALVSWTSIDDALQTAQVLGVTSLLSTSTVWSAPFAFFN